MRLRDIQQSFAEVGYSSSKLQDAHKRLRLASDALAEVYAAAGALIAALEPVPDELREQVDRLKVAMGNRP